MDPVFVFALSVATAIVGQFLKYVWSFKPVRVTGSDTPVEHLTHAALECSASSHALKRVSARKPAPNPAPKRMRRSARRRGGASQLSYLIRENEQGR